MPMRDSIDKIVTYFGAITTTPFEYKGTLYTPRPLQVSPLIFRGYTCPSGCGGCCPRFSLDYIPVEDRPYSLTKRDVLFDGRNVAVWSDTQTDHDDHHCRNLDMDTGRCGIHGRHPFSCDFELIRFTIMQPPRPNYVSRRLFGRGWAMLRIDGERGALCEMLPPTDDTVKDVVRSLLRLVEWADHFGVDHSLHEVIRWVESGPHDKPLVIA